MVCVCMGGGWGGGGCGEGGVRGVVVWGGCGDAEERCGVMDYDVSWLLA